MQCVPVLVGRSGECGSPKNVKVITGAGLVGHFMKTSMSDRQYRTKCGGHLMINHPPFKLRTKIPGAVLRGPAMDTRRSYYL